MKKGDKVIIVYNPHHKGAEQITGTIVDYKGERICGSDIYYVEYVNPQDGESHVMPLGHHNLQANRLTPATRIISGRKLPGGYRSWNTGA